jgi:hypothetical protein
MRLLKKDEIRKELAEERKSQIDEGLAIAKKVDAMRELLQIEQKNLDTFRYKTVALVQKEIDDILKKKDDASAELQELMEKVSKSKLLSDKK